MTAVWGTVAWATRCVMLGCAVLVLIGQHSRAGATGALPTAAAPAAVATSVASETPSDFGLTEVSSSTSGRAVNLEFKTSALVGDTPVTVLLPANYASSPKKRYPVLYLLDGCCNSYNTWINEEGVDAMTAKLGVIVVMAASGEAGFFMNWYNEGHFGPPEWETYYIDQLLPWIDAHYRTTGAKRGRALAGMSMGGFGAMSLAAQYPNLFSAAASFSGLVNLDAAGGWTIVDVLTPLEGNTVDGNAIFGNHITQSIREIGANPYDLAENLRGLTLVIRSGNGLPGGPLGYGSGIPGLDPLEVNVGTESLEFHQKLDSLGIANVYDNYGAGNHSAPYWERDLSETLPEIMASFAHPPTVRPVTYTSIQPSYSAYGWNVVINRAAIEFSTLSDASGSGFSLSGSGTASVTTPSLYKARSRHLVTITGGWGSSSTVMTANAHGELAIPLELGPSNTFQEDTPQADLAGEHVYTTGVVISTSS